MKKGERYYSATHGLIEVVDGRRRVDLDGDAYILVRDEDLLTVKQWLGHQLIALTDNQWSAIVRLSSQHYLLREYVIDQFRQGWTPKNVGNKLQSTVDQLLCNGGVR